jgi:translocation and assembly module TamA
MIVASSIQMIRCEAKKSLTLMKLSISPKSTSLTPKLIYCQAIILVLLLISAQMAYAANILSVEISGVVKGEVLDNISKSLSILAAAKQTNKTDLSALTDQVIGNLRKGRLVAGAAKPNNEPALSAQTIQRLHSKAQKEIEQAIAPFGFYQATIKQSLNIKADQWQALYAVELGPQIKIQTIAVKVLGAAAHEATVKTLIAKLPFKEGDKLTHQPYSAYKKLLFDTVFGLGYIDAKYAKSELRVDIKNQHASIILDLDSGSKYFFGPIKIKQSVVEDALVKKLVIINDETAFNTDRLIELQLRLMDTGYFANTEISIDKESAVSQHIPVTITATPSKTLKYSTSVGFGTDTGPRVGLGVLNRRVNSYGHNLQLSTRLSAVESNLGAQYKIPIGSINKESLDFFSNIDKENINDTESVQYSLGSAVNKNLWDGRARFSITLLQEQFSFDNESDQTANLLMPGITFTYKKADNALLTRKGYSFSANIHGGLESSVTDTSFLYSNVSGRSVIPLNNKTRLLKRLDLGLIVTDDFDDLPPSERFFAGGGQSVRGYDYKDIGEVNSFGNNIGGKYLVAMSTEIDYLLWKNYGAAVFFDAGDATIDSQLDLKKSFGVGFRYRSAIGMIRVDFAHPLDDPNENLRLHISIGPDL